MAVATGVGKLVAFKKETANLLMGIGATASTTGGMYLRRVTSDLDLSKDTFESQEIRADYQVGDMRHGMRKVGGTVKGELSPGAYDEFMASVLRKAWSVSPAPTMAALTVTTTATTGTYTLTRGAGSFITDGVKIGHVLRIGSGTAVSSTDLNKNLFVIGVAATTLTVIPRDGSMTPTAASTVTFVTTGIGKYVWAPTTGHVNDSYSIEHYYSDLTKSELFTGCRVNSVSLGLPATGIATCDVNFVGAGFNEGFTGTSGAPVYGTFAGASQYFTSPTAANTAGLLTAVAGVLVTTVSGTSTKVATITGLTVDVQGGMTTGAVVGSNLTPDVFAGRVKASGQLTAYFDSITMRDYFVNETAFGISVVMYSDSTVGSKFISLSMPYCKANGATKSDGEQGLVMTIPFVALFNPVASDTTDGTLMTTMMIQDSDAT